jgi:phosphinothricin acetyltransferase
MLIRPVTNTVTDTDIGRIAEIYGDAVRTGTGSFELEAPSVAEMAGRIDKVTVAGHVWLVVEVDGLVAGYGYYGAYHPRPGYRWTVEISIYVDPAFQRRGIGRALVERLVAEATERGHRQMLALIGDSRNTGSIAVHRAAGFVHAGTLDAVGYKFGRWLDVVVMQRPLGPGAGEPPA